MKKKQQKEETNVFTCPLCGNLTVQVGGTKESKRILRCGECGAKTKHRITGSGKTLKQEKE